VSSAQALLALALLENLAYGDDLPAYRGRETVLERVELPRGSRELV
jgi:hypothetical protein